MKSEDSYNGGLYYDRSGRPLPLQVIGARIAGPAPTDSRALARMALDLYFVRMHWAAEYENEQRVPFTRWINDTVALSRSYALDLVKCVRELAEHDKLGPRRDLDTDFQELVLGTFERYGMGILREVIHAPRND